LGAAVCPAEAEGTFDATFFAATAFYPSAMGSVLRYKVIQSIRLYTQLGEKFREVFFLNADLFFQDAHLFG